MTSTSRVQVVAAVGALVLAGAVGLFAAGRPWQTLTAGRPRPLADVVIQLAGRTLEPVVPALALVALAAVVAVLATRGMVRRIVGALLIGVGAVLVWRSIVGLMSISPSRAVSLAQERASGVGFVLPGQRVHIAVHWISPVLAIACGAVILAAGVLVAWRGGTWSALSARYDATAPRTSGDRRPSDTLWAALDRGEDPTARTES